jgi:hypothetical protein
MIDQPISIIDILMKAGSGADLPVRKLMAKCRAGLSVEQKIDLRSDCGRQDLLNVRSKTGV